MNWCSLSSLRWPVAYLMYATMYAPVKSLWGTAQVAPPLIQWLTEPTFFWCGPKPSVEPKAHFFYLVLQIGCFSLQQNVFARMPGKRWGTYLFSMLTEDIVRLHHGC